jgi:hypothetical protein
MRLRLAGWSCQQVAHALLLDDDTVRGWRKLFEQRGIEGIASFDGDGSASYLTAKQEDDLKAWAGAALPRSTRQTGAWTLKEFGLVYENRSGPVALLSAPSGSRRSQAGRHSAQPRIKSGGDEDQQKAFIESFGKLLNSLPDSEAVLFAGGPGAGPEEPRDRANERAPADQHSRRDRSLDRPNPIGRGIDRRRRLDDTAFGIDRGALSDARARPCLSRQRALSSPPGFNPGINRCRRLAKDCENLTRNALAFLRLASFRPMLGKPCLS